MSKRSHIAPVRNGAIATAARPDQSHQSMAVAPSLRSATTACGTGARIRPPNDRPEYASLEFAKQADGTSGPRSLADLAGAGAVWGERPDATPGREAAL
jgi:hypothetical protein